MPRKLTPPTYFNVQCLVALNILQCCIKCCFALCLVPHLVNLIFSIYLLHYALLHIWALCCLFWHSVCFQCFKIYTCLKATLSQGFICPVCMKMCVTATDLSEHYQEHVGIETRRLELRELPTATVGLVYLASVAWFWDAWKNKCFSFLVALVWAPSAFLDTSYSRKIQGVLVVVGFF